MNQTYSRRWLANAKANAAQFRQVQAEREQDPRFAEVVAAKRRIEYFRNKLVDFRNHKDHWADASKFPVEMEEDNLKRSIEWARKEYQRANEQAQYVGAVSAPEQGERGWVVRWAVEGFTITVHASRIFPTVDGADNFAKKLRAERGKKLNEIAII